MSEDTLSRALGRIEGKQDLLLSRVDSVTKDQDILSAEVGRLNQRVESVEKKLVWWTGAAASASAVIYFFRDKVAAIFG